MHHKVYSHWRQKEKAPKRITLFYLFDVACFRLHIQRRELFLWESVLGIREACL